MCVFTHIFTAWSMAMKPKKMAATAAVWHEEGADQPDEETLTIATVDLIAKSAKKWITISDEVMDVRGQAFLDYIYDEIEYQIDQ